MKRQVAVALYHRDRFSQGATRKALGYEAFHWGIIIMPQESKGRECQAFDATDKSDIDPVTFRMNNPTMDWWLQDKEKIDPTLSTKLVGRIIIGEMPAEIAYADLKDFFERVPLPVKNTDPQQSCVSWVLDSIRALQREGWAESFDIDEFKGRALRFADERLKRRVPRNQETEGAIVSYLDISI